MCVYILVKPEKVELKKKKKIFIYIFAADKHYLMKPRGFENVS